MINAFLKSVAAVFPWSAMNTRLIVFLVCGFSYGMSYASTTDDIFKRVRAGGGARLLQNYLQENPGEMERIVAVGSRDTDASVRIATLDTMSELKVSCNIGGAIAVQQLRDLNKFVRMKAANYMSSVECKVPELISVIQLEKDEQVLKYFISAAAQAKDIRAIGVLSDIQKDKNKSAVLRLTASRGLAVLGHTPDYKLIEGFIVNGAPDEREMALKAASYTAATQLLKVISVFTRGEGEIAGYALIAENGILVNSKRGQEAKADHLTSLFTHSNQKLRAWAFYTALTGQYTPELELQVKLIAQDVKNPYREDALTGLLLSGRISLGEVRDIESGYQQ